MLCIGLAGALVLAAWAGLGRLVVKTAEDPVLPVLAGIFAAEIYLQTAQLAFPLSSTVNWLWVLAGVGLYARQYGKQPIQLLGVGAILTALSLAASRMPLLYDTGYYHLQTFRWLREEPVTLGMVHHFAVLGFNSSWLLLGAGMPSELGTPEASVGCTVALVTLLLLAATHDVRRKEYFTLTALCALGISSRWFLLPHLGSPGTDLPAWIFSMLALREISKQDPDARTLTLSVLLAVATKLSQAPTTLLLLFAGSSLHQLPRRVKLCLGVFSALWLTRGFLQTGCLLYPAPYLCDFGAPWSVSKNWARAHVGWIEAWAKDPNTHYSRLGIDWLRTWWNYNVGLGAITGCLVTFLLALHAARKNKRPRGWKLISVCIVGIAFWFYSAPDVRFGWTYLLGLPISLMLVSDIFSQRRVSIPISLLALALFSKGAFYSPRSPREIPAPPFAWTETTEGWRVRSPISQSGELGRCWDLPIPCTSHFYPHFNCTRKSRWLVCTPQAPTSVGNGLRSGNID